MKDVEKTDLNYQAQIDTLNLEEISHRDKMDRVLQDLQVVEETRITNTKDLLYTVSTAAMEVFSTTMEGWGGDEVVPNGNSVTPRHMSRLDIACIAKSNAQLRMVSRQSSSPAMHDTYED